MSEKLGLVGRKIGMTRIFTDDGVSVPVTVLDVSNNRVTMVTPQSRSPSAQRSRRASASLSPASSLRLVSKLLAL